MMMIIIAIVVIIKLKLQVLKYGVYSNIILIIIYGYEFVIKKNLDDGRFKQVLNSVPLAHWGTLEGIIWALTP